MGGWLASASTSCTCLAQNNVKKGASRELDVLPIRFWITMNRTVAGGSDIVVATFKSERSFDNCHMYMLGCQPTLQPKVFKPLRSVSFQSGAELILGNDGTVTAGDLLSEK